MEIYFILLDIINKIIILYFEWNHWSSTWWWI